MPSEPSRKPHKATLGGLPGADRRLNRLAPGLCSRCGRDDLRVMLRTDYVVYFRCEHCLQMWSVAKPGEQFGT
jgi:hypothetical protein